MKSSLAIKLLLVCFTLTALAFNSAFSQTKYLDTSFNHRGIRTQALSPTQAWGTAVTLDSQSNILVAGFAYIGKWQFGLMRLRSDGSLDTSLQHSGTLTTPTSTEGDMVQAIATGPQNKITLAGFYFNTATNKDHFVVIRYLQDGTLDSTFGANGTVYDTIIIGRANAVLVQPDSKTIVIGTGGYSLHDTGGFMLLRLLANGQPDSSFGVSGVVRTVIPNITSYAKTALLLAEGKILVGGSNRTNFILARYKADGSRDSSFGDNGVAMIPVGSGNAYAATLLYQPDSSVVLAGHISNNNSKNPAVAIVCVLPDGSLKRTFGIDGKMIDTASGPAMYVGGAARLSDGEIIVGGTADDNIHSNFAIARYLPNGRQDRGFNGNGLLLTQVGESYSYIMAMAAQPDDKIIAAGWSWGKSVSNEIAIVRYQSFTSLAIEVLSASNPDVRVYPNPVKNFITIEGLGAGGKATVISITGQQVSSSPIVSSRQELNLSSLPAGTYMLILTDKNGSTTAKITKE